MSGTGVSSGPIGAAPTVGFIGLGRMGEPMAANVAQAGFPLVVWNRTVARAETIASRVDATVASTPLELAQRCEVVVTMLADDESSRSVFLSADGVFAAAAGASAVVAMGTHSPAHIDELAAAAGGRAVVDAPVSGSIDAARDATLLVMAGARDDEVEPIQPVLKAMSREVVCMGRRGSGTAMKLAVNMLIHGLNQTVAEAIDLADAAGIDPRDAYRVIERSAAAAPMLGYRKAQYLDEPASPVSFALSLAGKDVGLALDLAASVGVRMPQAELNRSQLLAAESAGYGERDMAALLTYRRSQR